MGLAFAKLALAAMFPLEPWLFGKVPALGLAGAA